MDLQYDYQANKKLLEELKFVRSLTSSFEIRQLWALEISIGERILIQSWKILRESSMTIIPLV